MTITELYGSEIIIKVVNIDDTFCESYIFSAETLNLCAYLIFEGKKASKRANATQTWFDFQNKPLPLIPSEVLEILQTFKTEKQ